MRRIEFMEAGPQRDESAAAYLYSISSSSVPWALAMHLGCTWRMHACTTQIDYRQKYRLRSCMTVSLAVFRTQVSAWSKLPNSGLACLHITYIAPTGQGSYHDSANLCLCGHPGWLLRHSPHTVDCPMMGTAPRMQHWLAIFRLFKFTVTASRTYLRKTSSETLQQPCAVQCAQQTHRLPHLVAGCASRGRESLS